MRSPPGRPASSSPWAARRRTEPRPSPRMCSVPCAARSAEPAAGVRRRPGRAAPARRLGQTLGNTTLVRVLETSARPWSTCAAPTPPTTPVLEIALVPSRPVGPLQTVMERIEKLGRRWPASGAGPGGARGSRATGSRSRVSRRCASAVPSRHRNPAAPGGGGVLTRAAEPERRRRRRRTAPTVDVDDVIVAWATVLPRAAGGGTQRVRRAQPRCRWN